jgi:hypothetical protein
MTLLELVVGLTVTGITVSAGYGAFSSMVDHHARAEAQMDEVARAAGGRRTIIAWLEGARLQVEQNGPLFRGLDGVYRGLPDDELSFLTTSPGSPRAGEPMVRLYIDRDTLTPERGLSAEVSGSTETQRIEIEPHAAGLDLRYSTSALGQTEWLPSWISSTVLPLGVEVMVLPEPGDSLPPLLRLPIVVPIGAGR